MATAGYYTRAEPVRAEDGTLVCGERWALVRVNDRYQDEIIADDLSEVEATALYWREFEALVAEKTGVSDPVELRLDGADRTTRRPRQLTLKL